MSRGQNGNNPREVKLGGLVSDSLATVEPHFIAGAVVKALFTVYDHLYGSIKNGSRVAKAL